MRYDLQLFAEKTERATPKRRSDARREGNVAKSPDFSTALVFLAAVIALLVYVPSIYFSLAQLMIDLLGYGTRYAVDHQGVPIALRADISNVFYGLLPIILIAMVIGLFSSFLQVGFLFTPNVLIPKLSKINPLTGIQRLFSLQGLSMLIKSIIKILFIAGAIYFALNGSITQLAQLMYATPGVIMQNYASRSFNVLIDVAALYAALSVLDFFFERFRFERSIKMSKQEIKDEAKQQEGNQQVKGKIRERGRLIAFRRMMKRVPQADVVITNPTHYAIALQYDPKTMHAPQVVAKGVDQTALRIREIARENDVPIVENKPLARELYAQVEIEEFVPDSLFQAVAQVLAYVYRLKRKSM